MASTVPYGGDDFLREFERAVKQGGLKDAWIKEEGVDLINRIGLSDEEKDKVYYRNATQLPKL